MATTSEQVESGDLPSELSGLGRPEAVFPAKALAATGAGMVLLASGVLMVATGTAAIFGYLNVPFPKDGPPAEIVLGIGVGLFTSGAALIVVMLRRPTKPAPNAFRGFVIYPTAFVEAKDGRCTIFPWDQVEALINPQSALGDYHVQSADGRKIRVDHAVHGYQELLGMLRYRAKEDGLDRARTKIAAGESVAFGPFAVSRDSLEYKGKKLRWDQVGVFEVVLQQGHRRLRIKAQGALWPWCYALLYGLPNEGAFFELIGEVRSAQPRAWS